MKTEEPGADPADDERDLVEPGIGVGGAEGGGRRGRPGIADHPAATAATSALSDGTSRLAGKGLVPLRLPAAVSPGPVPASSSACADLGHRGHPGRHGCRVSRWPPHPMKHFRGQVDAARSPARPPGPGRDRDPDQGEHPAEQQSHRHRAERRSGEPDIASPARGHSGPPGGSCCREGNRRRQSGAWPMLSRSCGVGHRQHPPPQRLASVVAVGRCERPR